MMRLSSVGFVTVGAAALGSTWAVRHRSSQAVRSWAPPRDRGERLGALHARVVGDGADAIVLLHGLLATGDVFGAGFDHLARESRLVVPDLLGFGRSLMPGQGTFRVEDHLDALDELADASGLFDRRWSIGAHSMGSALAMHWAARHADRVDRVVCWGAPIYASPTDATAGVVDGAMARLFALDTQWAQRACRINCRHRSASGWLMAVADPTLPVAIARAGSLHTWPAFRDAMTNFVIQPPWRTLLSGFDGPGPSLELVWGSRDRVGDRQVVCELVDSDVAGVVTIVEGADHRLPMASPALCAAQLRACG